MFTTRVIVRTGTAEALTPAFDESVETTGEAIYGSSPLQAVAHADERGLVEAIDAAVVDACGDRLTFDGMSGRTVEIELHTPDAGVLTLRLAGAELTRPYKLSPTIYRVHAQWEVTRGQRHIGQLAGSSSRAVPRAPAYYGIGDSLIAAAVELSRRAWEPDRAQARLAELGGQRAVLRAKLDGVEFEMRERARQAYDGGHGLPEAKLARDAGVDRMTMRKWLGKR